MARRWQIAGGVVALLIVLVLFNAIPGWVFVLLVAAAIAVPVAGYLMLDPSQRRRLKGIRQRRQIGR